MAKQYRHKQVKIDNKLFWTNVCTKVSTSRLHHHHHDFFAPFYFHEYIKANNIIRFLRQSAILGHVLYLCMHLMYTTQVHWHCITNQNWCPHGIPEPQISHVCNQLLIKYDFYIKKIAILFVICDPICRERPISINNIINLM